MSIKAFIKNQSGFTYTLEAILGIFLIMGTVVYVTTNMPYTAQKTGEHSKVQLVNIGRDVLDLVEITPLTEIIPDFWTQVVYRNYTLVADKTFVAPGGSVNFTVYYAGTNNIVYKNLTLEETPLGLNSPKVNKNIYGSTIWNFSLSDAGEYNFRVYEGSSASPSSWSNYVTIYVGYYYLDTNVDGVSASSPIVNGSVYNSSGFGIPNLTIQVLDDNYNVVIPSATNTTYGRIIEDFENINTATGNWTSDRSLSLNNSPSYYTQGNNSLSLNGTSSFWISKTNSTVYNLNYYDILSFDFYARTAGEKIDIELSNNTNILNKFIWNNISVQNIGWNKINFNLKYPDKVEGTLTAQDIDTINISVSNISTDDYLFDNLMAGSGSFSFNWSDLNLGPGNNAGTYYIDATGPLGASNKHLLIFSSMGGYIYSDKYTIYETDSANITLSPGGNFNKFTNTNNFIINQQKYVQYNSWSQKEIILTQLDDFTVKFTANTAGDYYIFYGNGQTGSAAKFTNTILIHVLPLDKSGCLFEECIMCSGFNSTETNLYMRRFVPPYINYNLYLINTNGSICMDCYPQFAPVINGYPTAEAVTVSKILHINQRRDLGYLRELRMVLWYK